MANVRSSGRDVVQSPIPFLFDQAIFMHLFTAPIWIAGAWWYFFGRESSGEGTRGRYRVLGWTYLFLLVFFIAAGGKSYYLWPIYPMLFAAGGVAIEQWTSLRARIVRPIYVTAIILGGALVAPIALPVLSPEGFIRYMQVSHLPIPEVEHQLTGPLHQQIYADMFGWEEMARETARAYNQFRRKFAPKPPLPPAVSAKLARSISSARNTACRKRISGHQTYWFWGPRDYTGESVFLLRDNPRRAHELCENVDVIGHVEHPYSRGDEHFDIYWCHPMRASLQEIWPRAKHFD